MVISLNGAYAYSGSKVLYNATIPVSMGNELLEDVLKIDKKITVGTDKMRYCARRIEQSHSSFSVSWDFTKYLPNHFHYVDMHFDDCVTFENLLRKYPDIRYQSYKDSDLITILHKNVRKGRALEVVLRELDIPASQVVGFGDDDNDLDFLEICGTWVAMENATEKVKQKCSHICQSNEDNGVARWIEGNIL